METFYEVREIGIIEYYPVVAALIRLAFADVAEEFHLTPQNCQNHPAFLSDTEMLEPLLKPGAICFGAFQIDAGILAGFAAIWPKERGRYELTRLCVLPEHRHAGLGARLLQASLLAAQERGARKIEIGTIAENTRLKAWYQRHGLRETAVKEYAHLPFRVCEMERTIMGEIK